jgi:hypothetical protein
MDPVSKAQAGNKQESSRIDRVKGHRFQKGVSGNPSGRPKKNHVTKMYEQLLANPNNRKAIKDAILKTLTSGRMSGVLQLREVAERTEGKVADIVDMNVSGTIALAETLQQRRKRRGNSES